jgi:1,4-dihydroxy-2-naphthoate polyprenyltransferase
LPAAIVPVLVGTAAAGMPFHLDRAVLAGVVALALQVGVNFANDYSDGIRGTDRVRTGPQRLVASGLATPAAVLRAAILSFGIAAAAGIALSLQVEPWLIVVGFASIAAAWFYTGGSKPYGYNGLGEVFCFIFFGFVGTLGSTYVQHGSFSIVSALASLAVGSLTTALLVVNNLRDIPGDAATGKRTLAVVVVHPWALVAFVAAAMAIRPVQTIRSGATGRALVPVLIDTGRLELAFGILFAASVGVSR